VYVAPDASVSCLLAKVLASSQNENANRSPTPPSCGVSTWMVALTPLGTVRGAG
jgi:hypothetical protein